MLNAEQALTPKERRSARRKTDEDIAERICVGVRVERSSAWRERGIAHDGPPSPDLRVTISAASRSMRRQGFAPS
jgi:hypothetical protein